MYLSLLENTDLAQENFMNFLCSTHRFSPFLSGELGRHKKLLCKKSVLCLRCAYYLPLCTKVGISLCFVCIYLWEFRLLLNI